MESEERIVELLKGIVFQLYVAIGLLAVIAGSVVFEGGF